MLKKVIVIFLLLQIISNNTFAEELIKLPKLFTHYYHHTYEHKDTKNFLDFIHKHYSNHHQNDAHSKQHSEEDNDCNLPFKHCGNCCVNVHTSAIGFVSSYLTTDFNFTFIKSTGFFYKNNTIENNNLSSIWQPPKIS